MSASYTIADKERDDSLNTGVRYGVQHSVSGRWHWKNGRFRDDPCPTFHSQREALGVMRQYLRESEIAFLELVPFQVHEPSARCKAEAAALMEAGARPLLPEA